MSKFSKKTPLSGNRHSFLTLCVFGCQFICLQVYSNIKQSLTFERTCKLTLDLFSPTAIMCDDDCEHFSTCISACPKKTCDNRLVYDQLLAECSQVQNLCFEGCDLLPCPPGQVYASLNKPATCIPEPLCETPSCTINGKVYREGERVYDDAVCNHACEIWSVGQFVVEGGWGWGRGGLGALGGVQRWVECVQPRL